ncbi:hypothetical protein YA0079_12150 [Pseudomonas syringae]|uniref:hypothetical protein n=2 Tax=Pseudomonas syringae TaxID=317 RepID=UPI0018E5F2D9|nr:hypothetical protein [Pseudomonas syringae]MBI6745980.1 hypothetical protein [Pseudomonas syringae]
MTILLSSLPDSEIRSTCKQKIESLEHWLRRLIDDTLTPIYGDYFSYQDVKGNRLIKNGLTAQVSDRQAREPMRYPRKIDAVLLDDAIEIICKPELFKSHFRAALVHAFPEGREEAKTFLGRIQAPRNYLAHANTISARAAEQIICYSNDVIESLREHYKSLNMQQEYDVPLILRITDSFGQTFTRGQLSSVHDGGISLSYRDNPDHFLRPGDTLTLEVEVDPTYEPDSYAINWASTKGLEGPCDAPKLIMTVLDRHVGQSIDIQCRITTKRGWHRMHMGADDFLIAYFKVLPPLL